jgi:xanthine dehydrogenase YagS FAD-binding subunit
MHAVLGGSDACIATHPSDMCVALAALDADVLVQGPAGQRTIPFRDFHLLPENTPQKEHSLNSEELITAVILPPPVVGARQRYVKLRDRESFEFALASAAVVVVLEGGRVRNARVALGGVATKPWRAIAAENALRGAAATAETFRAAAIAALRDAQPRKYNAFKVTLAQQAIQRALEEATA